MTPDSGSVPKPEAPPVISNMSPPGMPPASRPSASRQLLAFLLNLCLALFLADALVSLADDTLIVLFNAHPLTGIRGVVATFAVLVSMLVYVLMGCTPAIPKRVFLPVTLFNPVVLLLAIPAWIYFFSRGQQIAWVISLSQVLFAGLVLWRLGARWKPGWPLVPRPLVEARLFTWSNVVGFWTVNLCLVLPGVAAYLVFCGARAVNHFSDGFVALRPVGFTVQVRKYVRDDGKSILLVPMSHIGEPEFYRSLSQSFPTNAIILMEGVRDDKNLLTNRITYKRMANSLGLAQQQKEFKPSPVQVVMADIDVDQFAPGTIDFLNLVMLIHSKGLNAQNLLLLMQSSGSPDFEEQIFDDILHKRNRHLLGEIQDNLPLSAGLVVPWGAAHMPEIARGIQQSGFHLASSQEYVAIRFNRQKARRLNHQASMAP